MSAEHPLRRIIIDECRKVTETAFWNSILDVQDKHSAEQYATEQVLSVLERWCRFGAIYNDYRAKVYVRNVDCETPRVHVDITLEVHFRIRWQDKPEELTPPSEAVPKELLLA